jgi:hypothetical protein
MVKYISKNLCFIIICILACSGCKDSVSGKAVPSAEGITDLVLIYHGLDSRPVWDKNNIKHYIYRETDGTIEWLFDGFLFLELWTNIDGVMYDYRVDNEGKIPAGKTQWEFLINKFFEKGNGIDGIEEAIEEQAQKGFNPPYKRQIVLCIPTPQPGRNDWGSIDNNNLDFSVMQDRLKAVEWYIGRILDEWKKKNYKHLDFGGFYWLHETIGEEDGDLVRTVKSTLSERNIPLCWIPYYGASGSAQWDSFNFDIAYQQPNYFFKTETPMEIMTGALQFAKNHRLALEMEFDSRVSQPEYRERFYTYIKEFERVGAWNNLPIAYYDGADGWLKLATSNDSEMKKMYKALGDLLVKRQGKFSKIIGNDEK